MRWIIDNIFWDTSGRPRAGLSGAVWATRKLLLAVLAAVLLTWMEWEEHHPPFIAVIALIHFVFVLAVLALGLYIAQRLRRKVSPPR
jgi:hypothetical protein